MQLLIAPFHFPNVLIWKIDYVVLIYIYIGELAKVLEEAEFKVWLK